MNSCLKRKKSRKIFAKYASDRLFVTFSGMSGEEEGSEYTFEQYFQDQKEKYTVALDRIREMFGICEGVVRSRYESDGPRLLQTFVVLSFCEDYVREVMSRLLEIQSREYDDGQKQTLFIDPGQMVSKKYLDLDISPLTAAKEYITNFLGHIASENDREQLFIFIIKSFREARAEFMSALAHMSQFDDWLTVASLKPVAKLFSAMKGRELQTARIDEQFCFAVRNLCPSLSIEPLPPFTDEEETLQKQMVDALLSSLSEEPNDE